MPQLPGSRTQPVPRRGLVAQQIAVYNRQHPNRPIDPAAEFAVAAQEGLGGGIGDGGHAFGPNQLNDAGGVLTGKFKGQSPQQIQQWAWSPAGIQYALAGVGKVAGGLKGAAAVKNIVSRFERPADIPGETSRALSALGQPHPAGGGGGLLEALIGGSEQAVQAPLAQAAAPVPDFRAALAQGLEAAGGSPTHDLSSFYATLHQALQARQNAASGAAAGAVPQTVRTTPQPHQQGPQPVRGGGHIEGNTHGEQPSFLNALARLAAFEHAPIEINSGFRSREKQAQLYANRASNPNPVAPPGHSLHERGLAADGTVGGVPLGRLPAAVLKRFGLASVPGDPVHIQIAR